MVFLSLKSKAWHLMKHSNLIDNDENIKEFGENISLELNKHNFIILIARGFSNAIWKEKLFSSLFNSFAISTNCKSKNFFITSVQLRYQKEKWEHQEKFSLWAISWSCFSTPLLCSYVRILRVCLWKIKYMCTYETED